MKMSTNVVKLQNSTYINRKGFTIGVTLIIINKETNRKIPTKMPKLTRQQSALRKMNLLKMDILAILDETTERFDILYNPISPLKMAINDTINVVRQSMGRLHHIAILVNLYYLGELLNTTINPRQTWNNYIKENHTPNPTRYFTGAIRTYEIFQKDINQIY